MRKNRITAIMVMLMFTLSFVVPAAYASSVNDISGHWAEAYIAEMVGEGIISGYPDGSFKPEGKITRAEFAALLVKGFSLKGASGKVFNDTKDHWAKDFIAIANAENIVSGYSDISFGPDDPITREQMAVMIVKAKGLTDTSNGKRFADGNNIASWAKDAVAIASGNNLISGYPDNTFKPLGNATRAEAAVVLSKSKTISTSPVVQPENPDYSLITKAGTYGPETGSETVDGNVTVKAKDTVLQNLVIKGDLIIAKEVGDGDVTLNNIKVEGKTYIRGGGKESIHINGGQYNEVIVEKTASGAVRIVVVDNSGLKITISENAKGEEIILNGEFKSVTVNTDDVKLTTQTGSKIDELKVQSGLKDVNIDLAKDSTVKEMVLNSKVDVKGEGTITKASGSKANDSNFANAPGSVVETKSGGSSSGGSSTVAVSAINVEGSGVFGETLTATPDPVRATGAYQWMRADSADGEYTNIANATDSTYEVQAGDKFIKVKFTATGSYTGTKESDFIIAGEAVTLGIRGNGPATGHDGDDFDYATEYIAAGITFDAATNTITLDEATFDAYLAANPANIEKLRNGDRLYVGLAYTPPAEATHVMIGNNEASYSLSENGSFVHGNTYIGYFSFAEVITDGEETTYVAMDSKEYAQKTISWSKNDEDLGIEIRNVSFVKVTPQEKAMAAIKPSWELGDIEVITDTANLPSDVVAGDYKVSLTTAYDPVLNDYAKTRTVTTFITVPQGVTIYYPSWSTDNELTWKTGNSGDTVVYGMVGHPLSADNVAGTGYIYAKTELAEGTMFGFTIKLLDAADGWEDVVYGEDTLTIKRSEYEFTIEHADIEIPAIESSDNNVGSKIDVTSNNGELNKPGETAYTALKEAVFGENGNGNELEQYKIEVTLKAKEPNGDFGYTNKNVRIKNLEVIGPENGNGENLKVYLYAHTDNAWYDLVQTGWGSTGKGNGFNLYKDENTTLEAYAFATVAGEYTITFEAIDIDNENSVICSGSAKINVKVEDNGDEG